MLGLEIAERRLVVRAILKAGKWSERRGRIVDRP
jgi:hypothetical protein